MLTFGYAFLKPSAQKVIRLFSVSEPMEFRLPETPLTALYGLMAGIHGHRRRAGGQDAARCEQAAAGERRAGGV